MLFATLHASPLTTSDQIVGGLVWASVLSFIVAFGFGVAGLAL